MLRTHTLLVIVIFQAFLIMENKSVAHIYYYELNDIFAKLHLTRV